MAHSLYITGTEGSSGKTVVTLGLMHFLQSQVRKVAFFRPIIDSEDEARRDSSINLILKHFELDMLYRDTYACTYKEALELVTSGNMSLLIEKIFQKSQDYQNGRSPERSRVWYQKDILQKKDGISLWTAASTSA